MHTFLCLLFSLSSFQSLKICVPVSSGSIRDRIFKIGVVIENLMLYCRIKNQIADLFSSLCLSFFLSLLFSDIKIFVSIFSGTIQAMHIAIVCIEMFEFSRYLDSMLLSKSSRKVNFEWFVFIAKCSNLELGTEMDKQLLYRGMSKVTYALVHPFICPFSFYSFSRHLNIDHLNYSS